MTEEAFLKEDLIELRKDLGLTQQEMANKLDMALRSYQAIEAGESEYRFIHRLAVERVALMTAADKKAPMLAPDSVRKDAIELVRVGQLSGNPAFSPDRGAGRPGAATAGNPQDVRFRSAYGTVGELVLMATALDFQLNHVLIQVLQLGDSSMLESVVASFDMTRKIEMLKARSKHLTSDALKKPLVAYLDKLERISRWRNIACHTPLIPDDKEGAVFAPAAAAKLLKSITIGELPTSDRIPISALIQEIQRGEKALYDGQELVGNFKRVNRERQIRYGK
jgi:hypothetical protein